MIPSLPTARGSTGDAPFMTTTTKTEKILTEAIARDGKRILIAYLGGGAR